MIVAGCDVGSLTAKAVLVRDGEILSSHVIRVTGKSGQAAEDVMGQALSAAGVTMDDVACCVGTGYGRNKVPFAGHTRSEIECHGMAVKWLLPSVQTIIDVGGQDAKAIRVNDDGTIARFVYNDKCASGTGRFLEIMARAMETGLETLGNLSLKATAPVKISNQCTVFAETEVISQLNDGYSLEDIAGGLHRAMAHRVASLANSIDVLEDVAMSGGVAKNIGMYQALEEVLGVRLVKNDTVDPQINGALGAALFAAKIEEG